MISMMVLFSASDLNSSLFPGHAASWAVQLLLVLLFVFFGVFTDKGPELLFV